MLKTTKGTLGTTMIPGRTLTKQILSIGSVGLLVVPQSLAASADGPAAAATFAEFNSYVILASVLIGVGLFRKTREIE